MNVVIIDYGLSNVTCVCSAVEHLGYRCNITTVPEGLDGADKIILPGVGAFGDAIGNLHQMGMVDALNEAVCDRGKSFLGICLGAQLVCKDSDEHGDHKGLGWADAHVRRIEPGEMNLRVPHTGWDDVTLVGNSKLFEGIPQNALFYFTHSHAIYEEDQSIRRGTCKYGTSFAAALQVNDNIHATQFHPEKSQKYGLAVLANFLECC